ncbi:protein kinase [Acidobacteriota bacterium]
MTTECPKCQTDNPEDSKFCKECATPLPGINEAVRTKTLETPTEELTRGSTFADRYEIIEELGRGGMGKVYRVEDKKVKEEVALKLIKSKIAADKNTIERFRNELTTARKIAHRNVCRMFDLGEEKGQHFITMEYVSGGDLKRFIRRSEQLSIGKVISIAKQICDGLSEAHTLGVIHRDLKPNNIMIDDGGNVRIMDFGIARTVTGKGITGSGVIIGTPEYMSPEQAEAKEIDQRSDIYSLGIILYEMTTGRIPFEGETPLSVAMKHKGERPLDPKELNPQIPDDLSGIILKCLEKDKSARYQTAEQLRTVLDNIEKGTTATSGQTQAHPSQTSREITVMFRMKKLWMPVLAVVCLAALVTSILLFLPKKDIVLSKSDRSSLAVLPFEDLSPEKDQTSLCDGISESLINALSKIQDLKIPPRTSSFFFKRKEDNIQEIGEKLGVWNVLEGSIQRAGNNLRITVKLIDVADESVLWSRQYDKTLNDIFVIQDEITLNVVEELEVRLAGGERELLTKRYTTSGEAYQLYLQGRHFRWIETPESLLKAKDYFEQAIEMDPNYSSAYAGLADIYMMFGFISMMSRDEIAHEAFYFGEKAIELDENSSQTHTSMGVILEVFNWDWLGAEREFKRAITLNPNHFDAHYEYARLLDRLRRWDEAEIEYKKSLQIDPLSLVGHSFLAGLLTKKGKLEEAEEHSKIADELDSSSITGENAVERAQKRIKRDGKLPWALRNLALAYFQSGQEDKARQVVGEMERMYETSRAVNIAFDIATMYSIFDEKDSFLNWLEKAYERRDPRMIILYYRDFPDEITQDPRFKSILKKMNFE